jgi:hypothetical protein
MTCLKQLFEFLFLDMLILEFVYLDLYFCNGKLVGATGLLGANGVAGR